MDARHCHEWMGLGWTEFPRGISEASATAIVAPGTGERILVGGLRQALWCRKIPSAMSQHRNRWSQEQD